MLPTTHTKPREVISHFNTLLPLVITAKSVKVYGLLEMFLPASTQASVIVDYKINNIILIIILHFVFQGILWCFSYPLVQGNFKLKGFDFINYIFIQTQTNLAF